MDVLVIDATHGGVKLANEFSKLEEYENIYIHDIYNTLTDKERTRLGIKNVEVVELSEVDSKDILVISPVHLPLTSEEISSKINAENPKFITHHHGVRLLLESFFKDHPEILKVEVTGVKGKTSSAFMLKEILKYMHPLVLSSLGIIQSREYHDISLKKNVSITPASIKEAVDLAYRIDNPRCNMGCIKTENSAQVNYEILIAESSLGVTGIGDVGLLTNIVENYPIAKNRSDAKTAKSQIFKCSKIAIQKEALDKFYKNEYELFKEKINTFSINDNESNVIASNISYNIDGTAMEIIYKDVKTINGNLVSGRFEITSFAIGPHHVENILGVVTTALTLEIPEREIAEGLKNYKGIEGRTYIRNVGDLKIIEEINPGINTKAIEYSIDMLKNPEDYSIIIGGDYGITCEEIDESKVTHLLNEKKDLNIMLTGMVGNSINEKLDEKLPFKENYKDAVESGIDSNLNVLLIYRSDYHKLSQR